MVARLPFLEHRSPMLVVVEVAVLVAPLVLVVPVAVVQAL
jgi:hypothetical protein